MTSTDVTPIMIQRALERIRQERETFNQRKRHENMWFILRLIMGYVSVVLLAAIMAISAFVLVENDRFPDSAVGAAGGALFFDVLGLIAGVWRIALNPEFITKLQPVTDPSMPPDPVPQDDAARNSGDTSQ